MRYSLLVLLAVTHTVFGQSISSVRLDDYPGERKIVLTLDNATCPNVSKDFTPNDFTVTFLPSKTKIPSSSIAPVTLSDGQADVFEKTELICPFLQIGLNSHDQDSAPAAGDTQVQVAVRLAVDGKSVSLSATGTVYNAKNVKDLVSAAKTNLSTAVSGIKTKQEKDQFIGLNIVVPANNSTATSSNTDLVLNQTFYSAAVNDTAKHLFDSATVGIDLKKGTAAGSDPQYFSAGVQARKTYLLTNSEDLRTVRDAINSKDPMSAAAVDALQNIQRHFFRSLIWDNGAHFEGDAQGYKITNLSNAVYDTNAQLVAASQPFAGRQGFWNVRLMPAGFELGHNLTAQQTDNAQRGALARYKLGGDFLAHYASKDNSERRVEFEAFTIERYLMRSEIGVDATTKNLVMVNPGWKPWVEADLKFFFGISLFNIRPGLKFTYQRGSLPPVYASTKDFSFGFVFESTDDKSTSK